MTSKLFDRYYGFDSLGTVVTPGSQTIRIDTTNPLAEGFVFSVEPKPYQLWQYFIDRYRYYKKADCLTGQPYQLRYARLLIKQFGIETAVRSVEYHLKKMPWKILNLKTIWDLTPEFEGKYGNYWKKAGH